MNNHDRFAELWTDYLEGELNESGLKELQQLLAQDAELFESAVEMFQTHRLLGLIVAEEPERQDDFVRNTMNSLPENKEQFISSVMSDIHLTDSVQSKQTSPFSRYLTVKNIALTVSIALCFVFLLLSALNKPNLDQTAEHPQQPSKNTDSVKEVRLQNIAHARFFAELAPPVGSTLPALREYVLMSGLVELVFPNGATAIIEGPAVFKVLTEESLALDVGQCSVHAPEGAEGFRIETPSTRVVDRGTRFSINVNETNETEVQVIEGAADIFERSQDVSLKPDSEIRLTDGEARVFATSNEFSADIVPFDSSTYRHQLPDRIVSYETTAAPDGGAENLMSVTVQREGQAQKYLYEDLVPCEVIWFKTTSTGAFLCGGEQVPTSRTTITSDRSLITGVINPGGSRQPLTTSPVMQAESGTPGLGVRFSKPVINGPGADVLFFDLQTFSNPPDGDAFHVSPLVFREGLKSHSIRKYDLTMVSPESQNLSGFHIHMFDKPVDSLEMLKTAPSTPRFAGLKFSGLAVGIDLSDLGYAPGEAVEGLFFQDAHDDNHVVDPVYIGGLPSLE